MNLNSYIRLMRLNKPIGIFLLLWPTLWALWLASDGRPNLIVLTIFIFGVVVMRSAGCIINDFADRKFDAHVERTKDRPLATGEISSRAALILFVILCFCAFLPVLLLNKLTIELALVGALLAVIYPFLKRITYLPQLGLGLAFAWGVPMAFAAQLGYVSGQAWLVFAAAAVWPVIYDTIYAMVDKNDDVVIGVKSTAILFGRHTVLIITLLQILFLSILAIMGWLFLLRWPFFLSLILAAILFVYQLGLIKTFERDNFFKAFLNNHWIGLVVFLGIVASKMR